MLVPFAVTGRLTGTQARAVARAARSGDAIAASLAAARAEQEAVAALNQQLGRPSARPLLDLFAAIDAEQLGPGGNIRRLRLPRPVAPSRLVDANRRKIGVRR
jgi:hypothetical protein